MQEQDASNQQPGSGSAVLFEQRRDSGSDVPLEPLPAAVSDVPLEQQTALGTDIPFEQQPSLGSDILLEQQQVSRIDNLCEQNKMQHIAQAEHTLPENSRAEGCMSDATATEHAGVSNVSSSSGSGSGGGTSQAPLGDGHSDFCDNSMAAEVPSDTGHSDLSNNTACNNSSTPEAPSDATHSNVGNTPEVRSVAEHSNVSNNCGSNNSRTSEAPSSQLTSTTGVSSGRRPNPKLLKTRASSLAVPSLLAISNHSDAPVIDYKYRVHTKQLGHLYALCDAVPYLLGTRSYLKAIVAFGVPPVPIEAYLNQEGKLAIDPNEMSVLDKVFLMMLWRLRIPADQRPAGWEGSYAGMNIEGDRLIVYKDIGFGREPKVEAMHFYDFVTKVVDWHLLPNPALVAEDRPDVVTPWVVVAQKIREKCILLEDIDKGLYTEFVKMTVPQLDARLEELSTTDELEKRKKDIAEHIRKLNTKNTFTYIMPQETNPNVMYAKRFSHEHPLGYLLDTTKPGHDDLLFPEVKMRQDAEDFRKEREAAKKVSNQTRRKAKYRCRSALKWILAFSLLLGGAVGIMLLHYFKVSDQRDGGNNSQA
ncbi:hypothetical protein K458DRAFT_384287 [Lentithecium fluviatile CBS 122367]|uniref:Uncharacterized protein n=1 Tax=Lentithecium fluviatile CBS 122367 TaxID=1168545 RepID=A0A6G1JGQ8_9PLEO|nr:hypothetical protein K458DRAFT_384287 [Lentithecium fluviatile CBS 122367]